jgi:hypothetical protein
MEEANKTKTFKPPVWKRARCVKVSESELTVETLPEAGVPHATAPVIVLRNRFPRLSGQTDRVKIVAGNMRRIRAKSERIGG